MSKPLCIYHGNCADGFAAAWVVKKYFDEQEPDKGEQLDKVDFHPGVYQNPPPDVTDRDVIVVDFSYKRDVMTQICEAARSVLVLDHHKSAYEDLTGTKARKNMGEVEFTLGGGLQCNAVFDMERSGAMITWDNFFPDQDPPALLKHIQDRDLWRFDLPGTREIQAALFSYPYDFDVWDKFMGWDDFNLDVLRKEGTAIERKHFKDIDELLRVATVPLKIGENIVPAANLPYTMASDAGHMLVTNREYSWWSDEHTPAPEFAATYWVGPEGVTFSLRSEGDFDVSLIAKLYGGGGHKNAAGFRVSLEQFLEMRPWSMRRSTVEASATG